MRNYRREGVQPATALEALGESYGNAELTQLARQCVGPKPPTRKDHLLAILMQLLEGENLQSTWRKLTAREKAMAAETAWSRDGFLDSDRFEAKYETVSSPESESIEDAEDDKDDKEYFAGSRKHKVSFLDLIVPHGVMPRDIQQRIRKLAPKPPPAAIHTVVSPPDHVDMPVYTWNPKTNSTDESSEALPVVRRATEHAALHDLFAVLRLVDAGKVGITDKNRWPTPAAIRHVAQVLQDGDYYVEDQPKPKENKWEEESRPGPILAFAWPMLLQAGKLVEVHGSRLALAKAGRSALTVAPHITLRELWESWVDNRLLDELRRIDVIRGQTGNGKRDLSDPTERREVIEAALRECPIGRWTALDEFSRYMRAAGHQFEVTSDAWTLYIAEQRYGSLGYEGSGDWNILQFRYLLCVLMEYAAALGMVDIAYIPPQDARPDYGGMWGTDDLSFFSRYDGLMHFRLNGLGAFALGLKDSYAPPPLPAREVLRVLPNLEVVATGGLSSADQLVLDAFAEKVGDQSWRLDQDRILTAEGTGRSANELIAFLESSSGTAVPPEVGRFVADLASRADALRDAGPARLIRCASTDLAAAIADDAAAGKACALAGADLLVVAAKDAAAFDRAIRKMGYVLKRSSES